MKLQRGRLDFGAEPRGERQRSHLDFLSLSSYPSFINTFGAAFSHPRHLVLFDHQSRLLYRLDLRDAGKQKAWQLKCHPSCQTSPSSKAWHPVSILSTLSPRLNPQQPLSSHLQTPLPVRDHPLSLKLTTSSSLLRTIPLSG